MTATVKERIINGCINTVITIIFVMIGIKIGVPMAVIESNNYTDNKCDSVKIEMYKAIIEPLKEIKIQHDSTLYYLKR